ncbi:hypothetical protein PVAND_017522 [Polypedilum vanderplanki]|uniref:Uncharacterized protein n=1 Tax=Polypedilum vanderplanki TaxID=319348 RepID=A0A9J6BJS5_POLVA|nr:hypothetical protein PVAND_017522 [Polypedilum vanderplanki]
MTITKTAWIISIFNVISCLIFFLYRFLVFYEYIQLTNTDEISRYNIISRKDFNPNKTNFKDAEHGLVIEMSAYFLGILFNALLPLGVNTAREKNSFFFFPPYYVIAVFLSVVTFSLGLINVSLVYIGYSILNILFIIGVIGIHRAIIREAAYTRKYNADHGV